MTNKPHIWMDNLGTQFTNEAYKKLDKSLKKGLFPLYKHFAKTLTDEVYFCSRCGKRLGDGIHTCTPPADILRKAQEK